MKKLNEDFSEFIYPITNFEVKQNYTKEEIIRQCLIKCYYCSNENRKDAYKCNNEFCPMYCIKKTYMARPYKQFDNTTKERFRIQLLTNKTKSNETRNKEK